MIFEITQEEFEHLMLVTIEPTLLAFLFIAFAVFTISAYKKVEIRLFSVVLLLLAVAIIFAMFEIFVVEAILLVGSSVMSVLASIVLRIKTTNMEA